MKIVCRWGLVALTVAVVAGGAYADEIADQGRALLQEYKNTVVTVRTTVKMVGGFGGGSEEQQEITGAVIDSSGLTVLALSTIDPTSMIQAFMGQMGESVDMSVQVTDAKILLDSGAEIDAEIVLRDKDLDLAFVRPVVAPSEPMPCVDLANPGAPQVLDQVVALNRLGKVARRAYSVSLERIEAIVEKPRTFYIPGSQATATSMGSPIFTMDGKFVGIPVMRMIEGSGSGGFGMLLGGGQQSFMVIIVTAQDIQESAKQVPPFGEKPASEQGQQ